MPRGGVYFTQASIELDPVVYGGIYNLNSERMASIEALQRQDTAEGVRKVLQKALERYGFHRFVISGLPDSAKDIREYVMLSGWDDEWLGRYTERDYFSVDPLVRHCFTTTLPFDWSSARYDPERDVGTHRMMQDAKEFGMSDGICVPFHMDGGMQAAMSMKGDPKAISPSERLELHMLTVYALGQLRFLNTFSQEGLAQRTITPREAEMLKWAAMGKTAGEIAEITGTSVRTVNQHCENAQRRLGTRNRLQTVVEAMRRNLITL
ncbi:LuxR family transcriptional regulator [Devosia sp. SD17-2]|uniref:LuxR family transcriptional regulator n=1 Tax=Devosia sp. SD17-2 TaxID=2976459 RepID=UPI0023D80609|nr:LuxR family transcriptional regulator [Devosia sp. SD17-2]WEJ33036.1 LuxR family transcriptional regulator [Devosia sp. SD17-2]